MLNSLRFRIEGDNTSAIRGLNELGNKVKETGRNVSEHITDKLKDAFSVVVIEEAIRRTAEWSVQIARSAQELGISVEQMQALKEAAERANVATDKIFSYYDKLEAAANKALGGNKKLMDSFKQLGITVEDIKKASPSELLEKSFAGMGNAGGQSAALNLFGTKELLNVNSLRTEMNGRSIEEYTKDHSAQIVGNADVKDMAVAWTNILEDAKSIGIKLVPIAKIILNIIDGVLKMANGLLGESGHLIKGGWLGIKSIFSNKAGVEFSQWGKERELRNKAFGEAAGNFFPGMVSLGHWKPFHANTEGLSEDARREAEGAAEALGTLATFGTGGLTKTLGFGLGKVSSVAGRVGLEGLEGATVSGGRLSKFLSGPGGVMENGIAGTAFRKMLNARVTRMIKRNAPGEVQKMLKDLGMTGKDLGSITDREALADLVSERFANMTPVKLANFAARYAGPLGTAGIFGAVGTSDVASSNLFPNINGVSSPYNRTAMMNLSSFSSAGGSGNLAMGGTFGVSYQLDLLKLTEKTVSLLERIVSNTNPDRDKADSFVGNTGEGAVGNP